MKHTKSPNQLEIDELLDLANTESNSEEPSIILDDEKSDVLKFISLFKLFPGKEPVSTALLYDFYRQWSYFDIKSQTGFTKTLSKYFQVDIKGPHRYILINKNSLQITEEALKYLKDKKNKPKIKSKHWAKHFESFLNTNEIESGNLFIEDYILFNLYDKWVYERKMTEPTGVLGWKPFRQFCRLYLKMKIDAQNQVYFGVNSKIYNGYLTQGKIEELRQYEVERQRKIDEARKKDKERRQKEKNNK